MDRIGGPQAIRDGVLDSLSHNNPVTAKISWLSVPTDPSHRSSIEGKPRWIHCTPLLGSDEKVGVWMIVMVEQETVTGSLRRPSEVVPTAPTAAPAPSVPSSPIRGSVGEGAASPRFRADTGKLYAEYLRREGKSPPPPGGMPHSVPSRGSSTRATGEYQNRPFHDF